MRNVVGQMKLLGRTTEQVSVRGQGASGHKHTEWVDNLHIRAGGTYLGSDEVNGTVWGCCVQLYILCAVYSYLGKVAVGAGIGGSGPLHLPSHTERKRFLPPSKECTHRATLPWECLFHTCIKAPIGSRRPGSAG